MRDKLGLIMREKLVANFSRGSRYRLLEVNVLVLWYKLFRQLGFRGVVVLQILDPPTSFLSDISFGCILLNTTIGKRSGLRLSGRIIHNCMKSTFVDSIASADTATEMETTPIISSEVQSHSQNPQKDLSGLTRALRAITGIAWPDKIR